MINRDMEEAWELPGLGALWIVTHQRQEGTMSLRIRKPGGLGLPWAGPMGLFLGLVLSYYFAIIKPSL